MNAILQMAEARPGNNTGRQPPSGKVLRIALRATACGRPLTRGASTVPGGRVKSGRRRSPSGPRSGAADPGNGKERKGRVGELRGGAVRDRPSPSGGKAGRAGCGVVPGGDRRHAGQVDQDPLSALRMTIRQNVPPSWICPVIKPRWRAAASRASRAAGTCPRSGAVKKSRSSVGLGVRCCASSAASPPAGSPCWRAARRTSWSPPAGRAAVRAGRRSPSPFRLAGRRDQRRPRRPDRSRQDQVVPQVGEQRAVNVSEDVGGPSFLQDDLVHASPVGARPEVEPRCPGAEPPAPTGHACPSGLSATRCRLCSTSTPPGVPQRAWMLVATSVQRSQDSRLPAGAGEVAS